MKRAEGREPRRDVAQYREAEMGVAGGDQCTADKEAASRPETPQPPSAGHGQPRNLQQENSWAKGTRKATEVLWIRII